MDCEVSCDGSQSSDTAFEVPNERWNQDEAFSTVRLQLSASQHPGAVSSGPDQTIEKLHPRIAQSIARMEVTNPEVLRVTEAFCAFEQCGTPLRQSDRIFFGKSQVSDKIDTFWSHSWHGGSWKKIITLMVLYNSFPAMLVSFLTVALTMLLYGLGILPGIDRLGGIRFSTWSLSSGVLVANLVFLLWRPCSKVFLDRICISQDDDELKAQAIFSLAGLLKKSETMLILWDPSWTQRLWCLFELSAFLKSKQDPSQTDQTQALLVKPILLGPLSVAIFLTAFVFSLPLTLFPFDVTTVQVEVDALSIYVLPIGSAIFLGAAVGYWTVSTIRSYFRDLDVMKQQLLCISFDQTLSSCCQQNHVNTSGEPMLCDRKIVKECVNIWFGSQEAFEATVRSQVLDILTQDLSERVFTTSWTLAVTSPILWVFMDLAISFMADMADREVFYSHCLGFALEGLVLWLLAIPNLKDVMLWICRMTRFTRRNCYLEMVWNLAALSLILPQVLMIIGWYLFCHLRPTPRLANAAVFSGGLVVLSVGYWMLFKSLKKFA